MIVAANKNAIADRSNGTGHDPRTSDGRGQNQTRKCERLPAATLPRNGLTKEQRKLAQALNMQAQGAERLNQEATDILTHSLLVSNKLPHFYCHEEGREGRHQAGKYPFTADQGMAQPDRSATVTSFRASGKGG